jgi:hypothetical protein
MHMVGHWHLFIHDLQNIHSPALLGTGSPRVFNQDGANWYNQRFNGEAGERGVFANDIYSEFIPEGPDYAHTGTSFYYWGRNRTLGAPNMRICWIDEDQTPCMPGAETQQWDTTAEQDHYFYWSNVGQCGGTNQPIPELIQDFIDSDGTQVDADNTWQSTSAYATSTSRNRNGGGSGGYRTSSSSQYSYNNGAYTPSSTSLLRGRPTPPASSRNYGYPPSSYSQTP